MDNFTDIYNAHFDKPANAYLYYRDKYSIITLNGQGNAGKTTIGKQLHEDGFGIIANAYRSRDRFQRKFYANLQRSHEQQNIEVFGIPSFAWIGLEFHHKIKHFLNAGHSIILDHYLGDYYVDMLSELEDMSLFRALCVDVGIPWFTKTFSVYLDIDYDTYCERHDTRSHDLAINTKIAEKNFVDEDLFNARRKRYHALVERKLLKCVDATQDIDKVYIKVKKMLTHARQKDKERLHNDA